uniref:Uncharacterized protein n=1 Tax=Eptatretus burgeri TaxID=7764 RepID=A0A8C4R9B9_EPTBU
MGSRGSLRTSVLLVGSLALSSLRSAHCGLHSWERGDSRSPHFARSWDSGSRFVVTNPHFPEDSGSASGTRVYGVTTSTFVLSGDSTHNQAIVHWTGDNSSVSPGVCLYVSVGLWQPGIMAKHNPYLCVVRGDQGCIRKGIRRKTGAKSVCGS